jgi:hypothetical protein
LPSLEIIESLEVTFSYFTSWKVEYWKILGVNEKD